MQFVESNVLLPNMCVYHFTDHSQFIQIWEYQCDFFENQNTSKLIYQLYQNVIKDHKHQRSRITDVILKCIIKLVYR